MNVKKTINNIFKNNFYTFSLYSRQVAGTMVLFIIARYLSVYDYGIFTSYKALSAFILVLANMGFESYILISSQNNIVKVREKIALFILNAITLVLLVLSCLPFCFLESKLLFALIFIRTFFDGTFFGLILPYFQASKKFNIISIINTIYAFFIILIALICFILKLSLVKFLLLNIVLGLINFIQSSYFAKIPYLFIIKNIKISIQLIDKRILSYMLINICYILYSQIQNVFVSTQVIKEEAALYYAANTISGVVILVIIAQSQKIIPYFIELHNNKAISAIRKEVCKINILTIGIFIFFVIFGKVILSLLYGQTYYKNAYYILLMFSLANVFYGMGKIYITYIMAKDNTNIIIRIQVLSIIISVFTLILTYKLGIYSAALAYFLSAGYVGFAYMHKTKQLLEQSLLR